MIKPGFTISDLAVLDVYAAEQEADRGVVVVLDGGVLARHVRVPQLLAVVAEGGVAAGPHAVELRAVGAAARDHRVAAVGRGAPAGVRDRHEHAPQHELLVLEDQRRVGYGV